MRIRVRARRDARVPHWSPPGGCHRGLILCGRACRRSRASFLGSTDSRHGTPVVLSGLGRVALSLRGRRSQFPAIAAVVALAGFSLAACGQGEPGANQTTGPDVSAVAVEDLPADGVTSVTGLVVKDYEAGALPTDPYRRIDPGIVEYATDVNVALCMSDSGYHYPVVAYDWNDPGNKTFTGYSRARSVEEAQAYGYRLAPEDQVAARLEATAYIDAQPAAYHDELDRCFDQMFEDPLFSDLVADDVPFTEGRSENPAVKSAMEQWRTCMAPLGIPDLPEDAPGIAPSVAAQLGLDGADGQALTDLGAITAYEIEVAVADAQCQASSGYDRLVYDLTWYGQDQLLAANTADYEARRELIASQTQELTTYIEANRDKV